MGLTSRIMKRALGAQPSRPLLALTTILAPNRFMAELHRPDRHTRPQWGGKRAAFTLSFDLDLAGDIEAIPWLLKLLARYPFKAGFALIGKWVEKEPQAHAAIVTAGHEIINHTYSHPWSELFNPRPFSTLNYTEQQDEVALGHEILRRVLGVAPIGFRLPHLEPAPTIYPILRDLGYRYSSSALARRTQFTPFRADDAVWEFPLSQCPRHPSSVFDTYHAFRSKSRLFRIRREDEATFFDSFKRLLALNLASGAHLNLYFDPLDVRRFTDFGRFLDHVMAHESELLMGSYRDLLPVLEGEAC
ncbi:MAG TPA: polysaccharide deacetylase family protein [Anaerolineae bacterium]